MKRKSARSNSKNSFNCILPAVVRLNFFSGIGIVPSWSDAFSIPTLLDNIRHHGLLDEFHLALTSYPDSHNYPDELMMESAAFTAFKANECMENELFINVVKFIRHAGYCLADWLDFSTLKTVNLHAWTDFSHCREITSFASSLGTPITSTENDIRNWLFRNSSMNLLLTLHYKEAMDLSSALTAKLIFVTESVCGKSFARLKELYDLSSCIWSNGGQINWSSVVKAMAESGNRVPGFSVFSCCRTLFGAPVPDDFLDDLISTSPRRSLIEYWIPRTAILGSWQRNHHQNKMMEILIFGDGSIKSLKKLLTFKSLLGS